MISVAEARSVILENAPACAAETLDLHAALGRTLREDIVSHRDQPPFRASAMDGYALRAADTPGVLRLIGEAGAGRALGRALMPGECARIFTGAPLPDGADAVLIQEDAARDGELVTSPAVKANRHVRSAGVDFARGERLLETGQILNAASIALAAAAGRASVSVTRKPRVTVLSGGDELVGPEQEPAADQIYDSMSIGIAALAEQWGAAATAIGPLPDDAKTIADALRNAVSQSDLTVIVGGASVGDHDHARPAVRSLSGTLLFEKVALRPGKPTWFARIGDRIVLGLPGNPASGFVCARLFMRPLLDLMCGRNPVGSTRLSQARLRSNLAENGSRETYLRAAIETDDTGQVWANAAQQQDSSLLSVLTHAPALILRPPHAPPVSTGAVVDVLSL
ncbi:MAG: molybdopterin molybdotransferase MoeA [Hyphomonadaceae bacterium]|nr:molybdopterin molybdotransferase MoeA [Hyphomonadaceae bacterium]